MTSPTNIALTRLLAGGYEVYLPLSRPRFEELVILNRGTLSLCVLRSINIDKERGPVLNLNFMKDCDDFEYVIAIWSDREVAWLVPYAMVSDITALRLGNRDDLLICASENMNFDEDMTQQIVKEKLLTVGANRDRDFYSKLLNKKE